MSESLRLRLENNHVTLHRRKVATGELASSVLGTLVRGFKSLTLRKIKSQKHKLLVIIFCEMGRDLN